MIFPVILLLIIFKLSGYYKYYLDACFDDSFTRKDVDVKWNLLETIQNNIEDWDSNKGKGLGINYEYDCIKSFAETADFQELSAKYGLDPLIMVNCFRALASHINVPKGNGDVYHKPFKDTCIESDIVVDDCDKHARTFESPISYKHVNFCGVHRPCEQSHNKKDYCITHGNKETQMWLKALDELGEKVCELYPFLCEHCDDTGYFNFQCSSPNSYLSSTASLYCDDKITLNQHDELTLFLGCEKISRKTSLVDMRVCDINSPLRGCRLYCVKDCLTNTYIQNLIKHDVFPSYDRTNRCFYLVNREEESSKVSSVVSVSKPDYVEKMPFKPLPPKRESKKSMKTKKRSKRREETVSFPKHVAPIIDYDNSDWDDVPMPVIYVSDHDWEKHSTFDIENIFGTNSKVNNCCTISTIHISSYDDMFDEYAL
jgi:hypothetical protein